MKAFKMFLRSSIFLLAYCMICINTAQGDMNLISTYPFSEKVKAIAIDTMGDIYVAGSTSSPFNARFDNELNLLSQTSTSYNGYWGITILSNGEIIVTDCPNHGYNPPTGNNRVLKVDPAFNIIATQEILILQKIIFQKMN